MCNVRKFFLTRLFLFSKHVHFCCPSMTSTDKGLGGQPQANVKELIDEFTTDLNSQPTSLFKRESSNLLCDGSISISNNSNIASLCGPLSRIQKILSILHKMIQSNSKRNETSPSDILQTDNYGHQQLLDDFHHIQHVHCQQSLCLYFRDQFQCDDDCPLLKRHNRIKNVDDELGLFTPKLTNCKSKKQMEILNTKDIVLQQEMDKIHSYFLHPLEDLMQKQGTLSRWETVRGKSGYESEQIESDDDIEPQNESNFQFTDKLKIDTPRTDTMRTDTSRTDSLRTDTLRTDTLRTDSTRSHPASPQFLLSPTPQAPLRTDSIRSQPASPQFLLSPTPQTPQHLPLSAARLPSPFQTPVKSIHIAKQSTSSYTGQQEDVNWVKSALKSKLNVLANTKTLRSFTLRDEMCRRLTGGMGTFIWQSAQYVVYVLIDAVN